MTLPAYSFSMLCICWWYIHRRNGYCVHLKDGLFCYEVDIVWQVSECKCECVCVCTCVCICVCVCLEDGDKAPAVRKFNEGIV